jgi:hypothetical protein
MWSPFTGGVFMVSLISCKRPTKPLTVTNSTSPERGDAAGAVSAAEPSDFTPDRLGHASELHGVLLAG